jgi:hypothetical protein
MAQLHIRDHYVKSHREKEAKIGSAARENFGTGLLVSKSKYPTVEV